MSQLNSISPIDGRYAVQTEPLVPYFSEFGLIRYRLKVEVEFLVALLKFIGKPLATATTTKLKRLVTDFDETQAQEIKDIEQTTRHDVKAVEYWIGKQLDGLKLGELKPWVHFGLTSEDVNNLAYGMMVTDAYRQVLWPEIKVVLQTISSLAYAEAETVMLARTHGQSASPTTFGKEMAVFEQRMRHHLIALQITKLPTAKYKLAGKLAGATGNYNAFAAAFPKLDWILFAKDFVHGLGLDHNVLTTQIENHDQLGLWCDALSRFNLVTIGFCQDIWRYISDGYLVQKAVKGEVGSSTMPHKVNPIDFENAEGNLQTANAGLRFLTEKLLISRLQRDLTDSTVQRNIGVYFAHMLMAMKSLQRGLGKVSVNRVTMLAEVEKHPEVLAEAIQTILRREGIQDAYDQLKDLSRGKPLTLKMIAKWVELLPVKAKVKQEILKLKPAAYIGLAPQMVEFCPKREILDLL